VDTPDPASRGQSGSDQLAVRPQIDHQPILSWSEEQGGAAPIPAPGRQWGPGSRGREATAEGPLPLTLDRTVGIDQMLVGLEVSTTGRFWVSTEGIGHKRTRVHDLRHVFASHLVMARATSSRFSESSVTRPHSLRATPTLTFRRTIWRARRTASLTPSPNGEPWLRSRLVEQLLAFHRDSDLRSRKRAAKATS
jgi:hypothetical protein